MSERRKKLTEIANKMHENKCEWTVGRTDIQSYTHEGIPEHYVYRNSDNFRIRFTASNGDDALGKALAFAQYMNRPGSFIPDCEVLVKVLPIDANEQQQRRKITTIKEIQTAFINWEYEDELPEMSNEDFKSIFPSSKIISGVRMYPYIETKNGGKKWITNI